MCELQNFMALRGLTNFSTALTKPLESAYSSFTLASFELRLPAFRRRNHERISYSQALIGRCSTMHGNKDGHYRSGILQCATRRLDCARGKRRMLRGG